MSRQCRLIHFSGIVQGVGFRYTARRLSERFDVTGYVKNLPDGRVEVVVEGPSDQIDAFVQAVSDRMGHYIRQTDQ
ncbi:MAG: acylphosphatase, partial [Planctomycetota bacterium]|nr:acylphosphatase [Planctomycetota bacterium]